MSFAKIFKSYDIRGVVPEELDVKKAYAIGKAFAVYLQPEKVAVGRDMRLSSDDLAHGIMAGLSDGGATPVDIGLVSTDMVYFATGKYGLAGGIMITASHNPPEYNGMKMCREQAVPMSLEAGLAEVKVLAETIEIPEKMEVRGREELDVTPAWLEFALSFIDRGAVKPLKVVADAGNGMAGKIVPHLTKYLPLDLVPMYFDLDGNFPNHLPNPLDPVSLTTLKKRVVREEADLGLIFDGDADRVFMVDEKGEVLTGTVTTAMVADYMLEKNPGSTVLYNAICGNIVPDTVKNRGGEAIRTRVGHSLIKAKMAETNAVFAGEHSGHYYYRDNFRADSALITALIILQRLSRHEGTLSSLADKYRKYPSLDETNFEILDKETALLDIEKNYAEGEMDTLDGLTVRFADYWFNVRPSNTEPVLRLNMEADNQAILDREFARILKLLSRHGKMK